MAAIRRLVKELGEITAEGAPHKVAAAPYDEGNMFLWYAIIQGPSGSPYEGGTFELNLRFSDGMPANESPVF